MSYLATLFADPLSTQPVEHLTGHRFLAVKPTPGEPSYLICLSRTLADELIVENRSWLGRSLELLEHGLLFETDCPVHTGDKLRLEMAIDTRMIEGAGEVLHVQLRPDGLWTVLFEFGDLAEESVAVLAAVAATR